MKQVHHFYRRSFIRLWLVKRLSNEDETDRDKLDDVNNIECDIMDLDILDKDRLDDENTMVVDKLDVDMLMWKRWTGTLFRQPLDDITNSILAIYQILYIRATKLSDRKRYKHSRRKAYDTSDKRLLAIGLYALTIVWDSNGKQK